MGDCKAVQWWNDSTSGSFCLELHCKIQLTLHDGLPTETQSFERDLQLPPVPRRNLYSFRKVTEVKRWNYMESQKKEGEVKIDKLRTREKALQNERVNVQAAVDANNFQHRYRQFVKHT